jgi:hypothetical protein
MIPSPTLELPRSPGGEVRRCTFDRKLDPIDRVSTKMKRRERNRLFTSLRTEPILKLQGSPRTKHLMRFSSLQDIRNLYSVNYSCS